MTRGHASQPAAPPPAQAATAPRRCRISRPASPGPLEQLLSWLNLLPALIGAFVGAPLVAREFETGTWRLASTQAVPRGRWLTVKILLLGLGILLLTTSLAAVFGWYRAPLDALQGRFNANSYDFEGLSLPALTISRSLPGRCAAC